MTSSSRRSHGRKTFQLTRSRGRDIAALGVAEVVEISTHTLTWSVTKSRSLKNFKPGISTHTLTWSVTGEFKGFFDKLYISTHTLTWSVTKWECSVEPEINNFNSHAHVERDNRPAVGLTAERHFNSHAHVERDTMSN